MTGAYPIIYMYNIIYIYNIYIYIFIYIYIYGMVFNNPTEGFFEVAIEGYEKLSY